MDFVEGILWILCVGMGLAIVAGLWAFVREKILKRKPGSFRLIEHPCHIGSPGVGVSISVRCDGDRALLRTALSYYVFLFLVTFLFGPGLTGLYFYMPEKFHSPPLPVAIMVGMLSGLASIGFLNACWTVAFRFPTIEATSNGIEFRRGGETVATISRQDLIALDEETTQYRTKHRSHPNYALVAVTKEGERRTLWIVSDLLRHDEAKTLLRRTLDLPERIAAECDSSAERETVGASHATS